MDFVKVTEQYRAMKKLHEDSGREGEFMSVDDFFRNIAAYEQQQKVQKEREAQAWGNLCLFDVILRLFGF